jgi:hypothetical protein
MAASPREGILLVIVVRKRHPAFHQGVSSAEIAIGQNAKTKAGAYKTLVIVRLPLIKNTP